MTQTRLTVSSTAFGNNEEMPQRHAYSYDNVNPALTIENIPEETQSLAVICDDPDAPMERPFVHWVVFNIPKPSGDQLQIPEDSIPDAAIEGINDFKFIGYGGPKPPSGTHRYQFKVYALDSTVNLQAGADKMQLVNAMEGHILAEGQLTGLFPSEKA